jgi:hypothetical protein
VADDDAPTMAATTGTSMLAEPDSIAYQLADAVRATILNCNDGDCQMVDAWRDHQGSWHFEDHQPAQSFHSDQYGSSSKILMKVCEESE